MPNHFFEGWKRLGLGLVLLATAATILLLLDLPSRNREGAKRNGGIRRVAIVQHASIKALDDGRMGLMEQLARRGQVDGKTLSVRLFNAEGDIGTANAIAKDVVSGSFDLVVTLSTPSLQTVASANKNGSRIQHVFGLVTDPFAAGVGIDRNDPSKQPPYMTGFGSMQPVESLLKTILEMRPETKRIGLVWNPAESNSVAQTTLAREVCKKLSLELVENSVDNTAGIQEAVNSLLSRGLDAFWISGDITVSSASTVIIRSATSAGIPVFSSLPSSVLQGSLLDLGADYVSIGRTLGDITADVLEGKSPASIPVRNITEEILLFNETTIPKLRDRWTVSPAIRARANGWITETEKKIPAHLLPSK
ncbi:MAG: ABC transporter substrate-binding protein [Pirellulaceae bacterium]|jgi:ABC-type uncharacterized transport system substrate-binding protein